MYILFRWQIKERNTMFQYVTYKSAMEKLKMRSNFMPDSLCMQTPVSNTAYYEVSKDYLDHFLPVYM